MIQGKKEDVPGLVHYVKRAELQHCSGGHFKGTGFITLQVEVNDFDVWDKILEKLEGMVVYTTNDLIGTVVAAAQRRANRAESQVVKTMEDARARIDLLESQLSFAQIDCENLKAQVGQVLLEREELQEIIDVQDVVLQRQ
jgi:hypothetical protein